MSLILCQLRTSQQDGKQDQACQFSKKVTFSRVMLVTRVILNFKEKITSDLQALLGRWRILAKASTSSKNLEMLLHVLTLFNKNGKVSIISNSRITEPEQRRS